MALAPFVVIPALFHSLPGRVVTQWRPKDVVVTPKATPASHSSSSARRAVVRTFSSSYRSHSVSRSSAVTRSLSASRREAIIAKRAAARAVLVAAASSHAARSARYPAEPLHAAAPDDAFPDFGSAVMPVNEVPNWGAMTNSEEWLRTYSQMTAADFVPMPAYRLSELIIPLADLAANRTVENIGLITAKYAYSTRYFGRYDLDSGEFEGVHPAVDIKLALGTPIAVIGGGRVTRVDENDHLGHYVVVEHHVDGEIYFSIYGHMDGIKVQEGDDVTAGQIIGKVGLSGETASPHLHLQIDRDTGARPHVPFETANPVLSASEATSTVNPIPFIQRHTIL